MSMPYYIEKYKKDIYELQLLYETFYIDSNNKDELITLIKTLLHHRLMLNNIMYILRNTSHSLRM
jgi:hypothetical protein